MNIVVRNEYRVEIELSDPELHEFGITYEQLDYGSIETRRVLWSLLEDVRSSLGVDLDMSGKMLIEAQRAKNGCKICFTSLPSKGGSAPSVKQLIKTEELPVLFETSNIDDMIAACRSVSDSGNARLYEKNGKYRLFLFPESSEKAQVLCKLCEFGTCAKGSLLAEISCSELWNKIAVENAVEKMKALY